MRPRSTLQPLVALLTLMAVPVTAQYWVAKDTIALPARVEGVASLAAANWGERFYILDELRLEVLSLDSHGRLLERYGGWGDGAHSLDLPRDLAAAENSVFILDQGRHQILRLDARLNPVSTTPLPDDQLPAVFIRDARQRFWVVFEHRAGLFIYDDQGTLLDVVADENSGSMAVLDPALLAASPEEIAVWDPVDRTLSIFHLSGQLRLRLRVGWEGNMLSMVWAGNLLLLASEKELLQVDVSDGTLTPVTLREGVIDLAYRSPALYGLVPSGAMHVFLPVR